MTPSAIRLIKRLVFRRARRALSETVAPLDILHQPRMEGKGMQAARAKFAPERVACERCGPFKDAVEEATPQKSRSPAADSRKILRVLSHPAKSILTPFGRRRPFEWARPCMPRRLTGSAVGTRFDGA
jgi:hypothetical protein